MRDNSTDRVCTICHASFKPVSRKARTQLCNDPECRSELNRRNGLLRHTTAARHKVIKPLPGLQFRTVLQPCIAPYLATLAAASPTRTD